MKRNIALIGMPLSGKSTVGRILASKLDMLFLDLDEFIEYELSMSVEEIFEVGEELFRVNEAKALRTVCEFENTLIVCGGGAVVNADNRAELMKNCYTVFLSAEISTLFQREKKGRPLLDRPNALERLFDERKGHYVNTSDIIVKIDGKTPYEIADEIIKLLMDC